MVVNAEVIVYRLNYINTFMRRNEAATILSHETATLPHIAVHNPMQRLHKGAFENYTLIRTSAHTHFCTLKFNTWHFHWKKVLNFYCNVNGIRLLASALAYRSSDIYHSAGGYLATFSEHVLQLSVVGG